MRRSVRPEQIAIPMARGGVRYHLVQGVEVKVTPFVDQRVCRGGVRRLGRRRPRGADCAARLPGNAPRRQPNQARIHIPLLFAGIVREMRVKKQEARPRK